MSEWEQRRAQDSCGDRFEPGIYITPMLPWPARFLPRPPPWAPWRAMTVVDVDGTPVVTCKFFDTEASARAWAEQLVGRVA